MAAISPYERYSPRTSCSLFGPADMVVKIRHYGRDPGAACDEEKLITGPKGLCLSVGSLDE